MWSLLLACRDTDEGTTRRAKPGRPEAVEDSGTVPVDTGDSPTTPVEDPTTTPEPAATDACWLGPARDWSVCTATTPWDAGFGSDYDYPSSNDPAYAAPDRFVDLDALDPDLAIAPDFIASEYLAAWKGRWGVLQDHHSAELQAIRDTIGGPLTITSGYRSPGYNAGVGGVEYSRHQFGDASDLGASGWSVEELGEVCEDLGADYVGLYEDGHTHCDWRYEELDPAFFPTTTDRARAAAPTHEGRIERGTTWSAPATGFDEGEPFRRWSAWDAEGRLLITTTGRTFQPPAAATRIRVEVGGQLVLEEAP